MKSKHLLLTLLLALWVPWAAMAQSTLPLYENAEATNEYVPFYGWYGDEVQTDQMIYPADQLTAMVGKQITKMVFYWSSDYGSYALCDWNVSLGTTTATTLNGLNTTTSLSQVYSGPMDFNTTDKTMTIEFDEAFVYNGDNLLVQFYNPVTSSSEYHRYYFLGVEATGASYCYSSQQNFLPRVTFTYENPPACPKPSGLTVNYTGGTTATATWTGTADTYNIDINGTVTNDVTSPYQFTVELATTYTVKVQAACGSDWTNPVNFTTDACMPVDMCEIHLALTDSYGDGWNGNTLQVIDVATQNVLGTYAGVSHGGGNISYTDDFYLSVCNGSVIQFVYVKGAGNTYPDENSFVVYDVFGEIICQFEKDGTGPIGFEYTYTMSCTPPTCPKPQGLTVNYTGGTTATATWSGTADTYNIEINGAVTNGVTSPYDFTVELATDYTVRVQSVCGDKPGDWTNPFNFTTDACLLEDMCAITIELTDAYADGGGQIQVVNATTNEVLGTYTNSSSSTTYTLNVCDGTQLSFVFSSTDNWSYENGWVITDPVGEVISEHVGCSNSGSCDAPTAGVIATYTMDCFGCFKPSNLQVSDITTTSATLSWNGNNDSYVLQYRPWFQVGEDTQATGEFVTYTYDLSEFSGMGSIAIRHYDVTDMFYLNVDDVLLTDANGSTLFSEDFESGTIPSTWTNYDVDGDGYVWDLANSSNMTVNGNYGVYSASWLDGVALTPDNWLIISNVEMGGTFSFAAVGQDPNYPAENFAVYVSLESDITEVPVTGTTYNAENLQPGTPYAWQVKGVCGEEESNWVSALFKTKDNLLVFATDGNWNEVANWTDGEGNAATALPTTNNKVRIDADAIIPAGYVAEAGKATINGGSITIKDGAQLKHNAATLWVTMEKEITGIGLDNWNNQDYRGGWTFIATPFSGTTQIEENGTWSHVNNLAQDNYDLYAFDPTQKLEWINYKSEPNHSEFTAGNNNGLVFKKGYLYASEQDRTVTFTGTISKTIDNFITDTYEYTATSDVLNGWKLVGNPFACDAYVSYVDGENVLDADFYVMNAAGDGYGLIDSDEPLPPTEGAFINYSATGTVQFSTEIPTSGNTGMLNMTLSQGRGSIDQARVRFSQGFNLQHMSFRNNSSIYMPVDGNDFAVVYSEKNAGEMPVNFKAESNGTYTISFNTENISFSYLHLIDNMTGNDVNLLANPSYSFEAKTTDYASRFKLVFATGNNTEDNFAFMSNGNLIVSNEGEATLQVIDINGRILRNESINGSTSVSMNNTPGVYMLRLINGNDVKVQKIVVK